MQTLKILKSRVFNAASEPGWCWAVKFYAPLYLVSFISRSYRIIENERRILYWRCILAFVSIFLSASASDLPWPQIRCTIAINLCPCKYVSLSSFTIIMLSLLSGWANKYLTCSTWNCNGDWFAVITVGPKPFWSHRLGKNQHFRVRVSAPNNLLSQYANKTTARHWVMPSLIRIKAYTPPIIHHRSASRMGWGKSTSSASIPIVHTLTALLEHAPITPLPTSSSPSLR